MSAPLLLDTCALIWFVDGNLPRSAVDGLRAHMDGGSAVFVSPISAWELGMLAVSGKLRSSADPYTYFRAAIDWPGITLAVLSPEILITSSFLPGQPPRDPADRILAATARQMGYVLMTRDHKLLEYGAAGHLRVLAC